MFKENEVAKRESISRDTCSVIQRILKGREWAGDMLDYPVRHCYHLPGSFQMQNGIEHITAHSILNLDATSMSQSFNGTNRSPKFTTEW